MTMTTYIGRVKKYSRADMEEGAKNLPWENEAYKTHNMAHRKGHFDSTTFRRMKDKFNEEQLESNDSDIVGGKLDFPQFSFRGKDAYNTTMQAADGIGDPYSYDNKRDANDKKYPLLSSRHHTGDFYNPMQTTDRRTGVEQGRRKKLNRTGWLLAVLFLIHKEQGD